MRTALSRILGTALAATAVFGLLFSIMAIVQIWRMKPGVESSVNSTLDLLDATIVTTNEGLAIVESSLETASVNVDSLEGATETLAESLSASTPMVESLIDLVGNELPQTITATQTSLDSAQSSALLIDNMMTTLSQIPLLGLGRYRPEVPLNVALGQVSTSIDSLPTTLETIEDSLVTANANLKIIELQVSTIGKDIRLINENLADARGVIDEYQSTFLELRRRVTQAQAGLPTWLNRLAWLLTFVLVWLAIMQIGLFVQGAQLLEAKRVEITNTVE